MTNLHIENLWWFFSTVAQNYGTVVAIVGAFTLYRLQTLSDYEDRALTQMMPDDERKSKIAKYNTVKNDIREKFAPFLVVHLGIILFTLIAIPVSALSTSVGYVLMIIVIFGGFSITAYSIVRLTFAAVEIQDENIKRSKVDLLEMIKRMFK
jgi:hypothetical protein